jgi:hypothetical protein
MANLDQVISQIRYGIEQLSSKNAHHEFEHMCRHLARARICSNILPATGPVSAGGDQGRDFETFRTYLNSTPIADSTFVGLVSDKPIAFACSLEKKEKIKGKIESDVKTIVSSGSDIEAVHYFCGADLEVAKRHKLKSWAREIHQLELEIYDGNAISELLANREVFWIAEKYLSIPAEIFPRAPESEDDAWYSAAFSKWKEQTPTGNNFEEFGELKIAARHSFYNERFGQDLSFWLGLIEKNYFNSQFSELKRRAVYEVCVLNLRGFNSLNGYEENLRWYFSDIPTLTTAVDLEDLHALLSYCVGAISRGYVQLTRHEVSGWRQTLIQRIDERLEENVHPNVRAALLKAKGGTFLLVDPLNLAIPNFEKAIEWWLKLADMLESAPMFPLEQFSNQTTQLLEWMLEINGKAKIPQTYFELTEKLDALLSNRHGGFTAAENCRKRAEILHEQGRILDAIDLLHRSKLDWYASETLREALSVMLFLSRAYMSLGLFFAAKYYAIAVAFIGVNNSQAKVKPFISVGLMRAATWDYIIGAFCDFLNITEIEIKIHQAHARNAGDLANNSELQSVVFHLLMLKALSERLNPEFEKEVERRINAWLPTEWIDGILPTARESLQGMTDEQLGIHLVNELHGIPYGDLEPKRKVAWLSLGIEWRAIWKNNYETTKVAEQFLAILQIYLAEIANHDLCLLKTKVHIIIESVDSEEIEYHAAPSNKDRVWMVKLPRNITYSPTDLGRIHIDVFAAVSRILFEVSLLPERDYFNIMESLFRKGLAERIFVAHPYETVYAQFVGEEDFNRFPRTMEHNPLAEIESPLFEHEELRWNDRPGPTYNREEAEQALQRRYINVLPSIRYTLPRLRRSRIFMRTVESLRQKGWLDWHILCAVSAATMTERLNQRMKADDNDPNKINEIWMTLSEEKPKWKPVPMDIFHEDTLYHCLQTSMVSTLQGLGLECHQVTPDFNAIDGFLRYRYNYWSDDIPHTDPFAKGPK